MTIEWRYPKTDPESLPAPSVENPTGRVLRRGQREFVTHLAHNVAVGMDLGAAKIDAVKKSYQRKNYSTNGARKKANSLLNGSHHYLNEALLYLFEAGGLTQGEIIDWHIKHIRGDIVRETVARDGKIVKYKPGPDLQALLAAEQLVFPKAPKDVRVAGNISVDVVGGVNKNSMMVARSLAQSVALVTNEEADDEVGGQQTESVFALQAE